MWTNAMNLADGSVCQGLQMLGEYATSYVWAKL